VFSKACVYYSVCQPLPLPLCRPLRLVICTSQHQMKKDRLFFVRASWSKRKQSVMIGNINLQHTCIGLLEARRSTPRSDKWLLQQISIAIVITRSTTPPATIEAVQLKCRILIAANKAKHTILGRTMVQRARQYQLLPAYLRELKKQGSPITASHQSRKEEEGDDVRGGLGKMNAN